MSVAKLVRRLRSGSSKLRPYESACLVAIQAELTAEGGRMLARQVEAIRQVQRFSDDKMVMLHVRELDQAEIFPATHEELTVASFAVRSGRVSVRGTLVLHRGRLSTLEFRSRPQFASGDEIEVAKVRIDHDPMQPPRARSTATHEQVGELHRLMPDAMAHDVQAPEKPTEQQQFLERVAICDDGLNELLAMTNGFSVGAWRFYGTQARSIVLPDETLVVVAEDDDGTQGICFVQGQKPAQVWLVDFINDYQRQSLASLTDGLLRPA